MEGKNHSKGNKETTATVNDELDSINARVRRLGPDRLRRSIEATVESKAKKRRSREAPLASGWKR